MAKLPAIPDAPLTTSPASMTPPPKPVPTIAAIEECSPPRRSEMHLVGIKRGRVAVVVIDDGQLQPVFQGAADIETAPGGMGEVR